MSPRLTSDNHPPRLRSFVEPSADLQKVIEEVADHVARHGPGSEFQLRSGREGPQRFPFLYLDNQYAPYYQTKVREARQRYKRSTTIDSTLEPQAPHPELPLLNAPQNSGPSSSAPTSTSDLDQLLLMDAAELSLLLDYTYGSTEENPAQRVLDTIFTTPPGSNTATQEPQQYNTHPRSSSTPANSSLHQTTPQHQSTRPTTSQSPAPIQIPLSTQYNGIPYDTHQEVHLLDSTGTERSGLNTFIVISNSEVDYPNLQSLQSDHNLSFNAEPTYCLRPDSRTIFRASHHRVLPVGMALGAEIEILDVDGAQGQQQKVVGIVIRRTVECGRRLYDVKGGDGVVWRDVSEEKVREHRGGVFDFRMPSRL